MARVSVEGAMSDVETRSEDPDFLEFCYRRVLRELGFSNEHASIVARCVSDGDRHGKRTQGMGVLEVTVLMARTGTMDVTARPEIVDEGPTWLVVDGHRSSGQWALTMATEAAIAKAREHAIAIAFARDYNDAGAFGTYVRMATDQGLFAMATNNSLPLVSPWGGMENVLSGAPFAAGAPGGSHPPIVSDIQAVEVHDGDLSEAYFQGRKLAGPFLVDPASGELTDDPAPYFERMDEYGRVSDCQAPTVFGTPRMYSFNLFTEMLASLINPGARIAPEIPGPPSVWLERQDQALTGGACVIVIDPSHWMPAEEPGRKSDRLIEKVKAAKRRPGVDEILLPGERGQRAVAAGGAVAILSAHWESFARIVESVGLTVDGLRADFSA
jgi:LDH2 family malate/lactate/ureidoglycolate dehydrogenase